MVRLCNEQNAIPILLITPYRKEYTDLFDDDFYSQYYGVIEELCKSEGCEFLDYSCDERFDLNDKYFADVYHMSKDGSNAFLTKVIRELVQ